MYDLAQHTVLVGGGIVRTLPEGGAELHGQVLSLAKRPQPAMPLPPG